MIESMREPPMFSNSNSTAPFHSRKWVIVLFAVFNLLINTSCNLKLHDKPPETSDIVFSAGQKVLCLSKTIPYFKAFLKGEPDGVNVKQFWECAEVAVSTFKEKSIGNAQGQYSAKAMALFFEKYFLDNIKISDVLIDETMRIKQLLLGGNRTHFDHQEMDEILHIIKGLGEHTDKLFPYMKVYTNSWKPQSQFWDEKEINYFENANKEFQEFTHDFASWLHLDGPDYEINHFVILLREFEKLSEPSSELAKPLQDYLPVLKKIKKVFSGGNEETINSTEWRNFLLLGSRGYFLYLRFNFFVDLKKSNITEQVWFISRAVDDGLAILSDLLQEKKYSQVSNNELLEVIEKLQEVYPKFQYSEKWLLQFMEIKKALLGGDDNNWGVEDFERARKKVEIIRKIAMDIIPYLDVLQNKWSYNLNDKEEAQIFFEEAFTALKDGVNQYSLLWEQPFDLAHVEAIFQETARLYPNTPIITELKNKWSLYYPLIIATNKMFTGANTTAWNKNQWKVFLNNSALFFQQYSYFNYFVKNQERQTLLGLNEWDSWFLKSANLLYLMIQEKNPSVWTYSEMDEVLDSLNKAQFLTGKFTVSFLKKTIHLLSSKYLVDKNLKLTVQGINLQNNGISLTQVDNIVQKWIDWIEVEQHIDLFYASFKDKKISFSEFKNKLSNYADQLKRNNKYTLTVDQFVQLGLQQQIPYLDSDMILAHLNSNDKSQELNFFSLEFLNLERLLVSMITDTYQSSHEIKFENKKLTQAEFQVFINDIAPILLDYGILTDYKEDYADKRFLEANLFSQGANGDGFISFSEGVNYLNMVISAYSRKSIFEKILVNKCKQSEINKFVFVDRECLEDLFMQNFTLVFNKDSLLIPYFQSLSDEKRSLFIDYIEQAADPVFVDDSMKQSDVIFMISIVQYVETVLNRFDLNSDNYLDTKEAITAFPVFRNLLAKMSEINDNENRLTAIFTYMLKYGKVPEKTISGLYDFWTWENSPEEWDVKASRLQFAKILATLQQEKKKKAETN